MSATKDKLEADFEAFVKDQEALEFEGWPEGYEADPEDMYECGCSKCLGIA